MVESIFFKEVDVKREMTKEGKKRFCILVFFIYEPDDEGHLER